MDFFPSLLKKVFCLPTNIGIRERILKSEKVVLFQKRVGKIWQSPCCVVTTPEDDKRRIHVRGIMEKNPSYVLSSKSSSRSHWHHSLAHSPKHASAANFLSRTTKKIEGSLPLRSGRCPDIERNRIRDSCVQQSFPLLITTSSKKKNSDEVASTYRRAHFQFFPLLLHRHKKVKKKKIRDDESQTRWRRRRW